LFLIRNTRHLWRREPVLLLIRPNARPRLSAGNTFQLEHLSHRAWHQTYGKSVQLCAPGMFVERLSRLAVSAGGIIVDINPWRARLSQTCHCGLIKKKARAERWHTCEQCGASVQRDLFSAYLARFVHPDTSLLNAGHAQAAWPGWEPTLQAAYEQAIHNQPARGRRLPAAFGRPPVDPSQSGSLAQGSRSRT
jgi:putative transposase